jgi:Holliday junction resolvase-like predicted endonuclease
MDKNLKVYFKPEPIKTDLRTALGKIKSAPDFEEYARRILAAEGYEVLTNQEIQGYCVTHEIDGVAIKDGKTCYVETKHHTKTRIFTPFIVTLAAKAKYDDIKKGYQNGKNSFNFDRVIIICNTRLTSHANQYAKCIGIEHIGWKTPQNNGIDAIITRNNLYPVTILKNLSRNEYEKMSSFGIVTLNDLINTDFNLLSAERIKELQKEAQIIIKKP